MRPRNSQKSVRRFDRVQGANQAEKQVSTRQVQPILRTFDTLSCPTKPNQNQKSKASENPGKSKSILAIMTQKKGEASRLWTVYRKGFCPYVSILWRCELRQSRTCLRRG